MALAYVCNYESYAYSRNSKLILCELILSTKRPDVVLVLKYTIQYCYNTQAKVYRLLHSRLCPLCCCERSITFSDVRMITCSAAKLVPTPLLDIFYSTPHQTYEIHVHGNGALELFYINSPDQGRY
jgi:hypothetical protein